DVIAPIHALGPVARYFHGDLPWNAGAFHVADRGAAQVMKQEAWHTGAPAGRFPYFSEVAHFVAILCEDPFACCPALVTFLLGHQYPFPHLAIYRHCSRPPVLGLGP